jgi:mannosyltransferase
MSVRNKRMLLVTILLFLMIVGGFLRFYQLSFQSLWSDEISTWYRTRYPTPAAVISLGASPDSHPPGYHLLMYFVLHGLGANEFTLRLPSAIAGILCIPAMFALGRVFYSTEVGLYAAALTTVLWCTVYYSQEGRANSLLVLFAILTSLLWYQILCRLRRSEQRRLLPLLAPAYVLTAAIAAYLHYFGLFLVGFQGIYAILAFVRRRQALVTVVLIYASFILLFLPWLRNTYLDLTGYTITYQRPTMYSLLKYGYFLYNNSSAVLALACAGFFFVAWKDGRALFRGPRKPFEDYLLDPTLVLLLWLVAPVLFAFVKSLVSRPVFVPRNLIICLPAAYLLSARALSLLPLRIRWRSAVAGALTAVLLFHLVVRMDYYRQPTKEQFREAVQYVIDHDAAVGGADLLGFAWTEEHLNFYLERLGSGLRVKQVLGLDAEIPQLETYLDQEHPQRLWYIAAHRIPQQAFLDALAHRMTFVERRDFIGASVWLWAAPVAD